MSQFPQTFQRRCLVTGLRGFTGHHLTHALAAAGYDIFGLAHETEDLPENVLSADLTDLAAVRVAINTIKPDVVIHLAAIAFVAHGDVDAIYRTNVVGTRNVLQALADCEYRPSAVLLASSANIYGNAEVPRIDEDTPAQPENDYAVSKLAMEYMARLWKDRLPITIVRPFNYTGVGQTTQFLIPKIVDHFRRRAPEIELGNLDVARDFSDVRTVVAAYVALLDQPASGQVFNICSGRSHSLGDVIELLEDIAGYRIVVKVNPAFVRANEVKRLTGDPTRLRAVVGELPAFELRETLSWMYHA